MVTAVYCRVTVVGVAAEGKVDWFLPLVFCPLPLTYLLLFVVELKK